MLYNLLILYYLTSKYTNRRNKLIDKVYKYITSYNKLSSKIGSNRKLLLTNLTSLKISAY
ncbi:hypothetical protein HBI80_148580 [Parastagonospora nodorum]|nr:hypothetical protein HBI80_148580 [Parastagonospora nodorum]KAH5601980.1 hypothetical protein HBI45_134750 [Parastagonospora nodorum]KAH5763340.1 hypothetical protein HBI16_169550 [Parastagonospora nodorum]